MAGVIKTHTPNTSKVSARGNTCLCACYTTDYTKDCIVMMDSQTKTIVHFRDALWLNWMYFQQSQGTPGAPVMVNGLTVPAEDGSVADSDESISSANKDKKKIRNLFETGNSSNFSNSMD